MATRHDTLLAQVIAERAGKPARPIAPADEARAARLALALSNPANGLARAAAWAERVHQLETAIASGGDSALLTVELKALREQGETTEGAAILRAIRVEEAHAELAAITARPDPTPLATALIGENGAAELKRLATSGGVVGPVLAGAQERIGAVAYDGLLAKVTQHERGQARAAALKKLIEANDADNGAIEAAKAQHDLAGIGKVAAENINRREAERKAADLQRQADEAKKAALPQGARTSL